MEMKTMINQLMNYELSALLLTVWIRKPVQRMNIAATNTKTYDDNMNVIHINIHDDVPRQLSEDEQVLHVLGVVMAQIYSIKNGIKSLVSVAVNW